MKPPVSKPGWGWVDCGMEHDAIEVLAERAGGVNYLLDMGDVYSIVREEMNNEVLEHLAEQEERCTNCGAEFVEAPDGEDRCPNCEPEAWTNAPDDEGGEEPNLDA